MLKPSYTLFLFTAVCFTQEQTAANQTQTPAQEPASLEGKLTSVLITQPRSYFEKNCREFALVVSDPGTRSARLRIPYSM